MSLLFALASALTLTGSCPDCGPGHEVEPPVVSIKVLAPDNAHASGKVPYRVLVVNRSAAKAFGVQVRFDLPTDTTLLESDPQPENVRGSLIWSLGNMPGKSQRELRVLLGTKSEGPIEACFRVAFEHGVCVTTQASCKEPGAAPAEKLPPPAPRTTGRLKVVKTGPAAQGMGVPIAYSINIVNEGPVTLRDIEVEDLLPPKSSYIPGSADNSGQIAGADAKRLLWKLTTLLPGEARTVTFKVRPTEAGTYLNVARARGLDPQGQSVNSEDSHSTTQVTGAATVYMEVRDSRDPLFLGEETTYGITIRNTGSAPATNIRLAAEIPAGMAVKRIGPPEDSGATAFKLGDKGIQFGAFSLQPGETKVFEVIAEGKQDGVWRFRTILHADVLDPAKGPLIEEETTTVQPETPIR